MENLSTARALNNEAGSSLSASNTRVQERWIRLRMLVLLSGLLILSLGWLALGLTSELSKRLAETRAIESTVNGLRYYGQLAVDLETGQRGYLLTGDEKYLAPYKAAHDALPTVAASMYYAFREDRSGSQLFARMEADLSKKNLEIEASLAIFQEKGLKPALRYMRTGFGLILMRDVRLQSERLISLQQDKLQTLHHGIPALVRQRDLTMLVLCALGLISGAAAYWSMHRHVEMLTQEAQLREQTTRAELASQEKSAFLSNMSHEIRTPMNAIFGFTQLLEQEVHGEKGKYYLKAIHASGKALLELINDILDLSKIEAGRLEVTPAPTDVRDLCVSISTIFSQMLAEKALKWKCNIDDNVPLSLNIDPIRLRQVLFNLVSNAIKYSDEGEIGLRIKTESIEQSSPQPNKQGNLVRCIVEVWDHGIGIRAEDQMRIFEPFTRVGEGGNSARSGSGLGLSIVRRLVELMDGSISVQSELGRGSVFKIEFENVSVLESSSSVTVPSSAQFATLPALSILIVDDVELNRSLLRSMFADSPHTTHLASGGAEGVQLTKRLLPDLVLMDIRMPEVDGRQALAQIRADSNLNNVKVLAVTASSLRRDETELRQTFDGYVRKPISRESLFGEISRIFPAQVQPLPDAVRSLEPATARVFDSGKSAAVLREIERTLAALDQATGTLASTDVARVLMFAKVINELSEDPQINHAIQTIARSAELFELAVLSPALTDLAHYLRHRKVELESPKHEHCDR